MVKALRVRIKIHLIVDLGKVIVRISDVTAIRMWVGRWWEEM